MNASHDLRPAEPAPVRERADAARNRARVLAAADRLFREGDPAAVTMDDIAKAAGIGRGTLYRRYPDRASIAQALLAPHERALRDRLAAAPAPLGPGGASPAERLAAFYTAMVGLLEEHVHLALGAETGRARYATGSYASWHAHVRQLAAEAQPAADPDVLADQLLAPVAPELYSAQRRRGVSPERIAAGLHEFAHGVLSPR